MTRIRGNEIAMIFQEPMTSLNPVLTISEQIAESLRCHRDLYGSAARAEVLRLLDAVRIPDGRRRAEAYRHQLSGGMRQRVMIAMALDEDTAAGYNRTVQVNKGDRRLCRPGRSSASGDILAPPEEGLAVGTHFLTERLVLGAALRDGNGEDGR
jgi:hypothetical protein